MSLWQNCSNNILQDLQENDVETCNIIMKTIKNINNVEKINLQFNDSDIIFLKTLLPIKLIFLNHNLYYSIHGITHTARVMLYSLIISKMLNIDYKLPVFIASLHDTQRQNDREDLNHSKRASLYFLNNIKTKYQEYIDKKDIISFVISNHNITNIDLMNEKNFEKIFYLNLLKTADALDRFRLPKEKWWPNQNMIPFKFFNSMLDRFKLFTCTTEIDFISNNRKLDFIDIVSDNIDVLISNI